MISFARTQPCRIAAAGFLLVASGLPGFGDARADDSIENDLYTVTIDGSSGHFSVTAKPAGKTFLQDGTLSEKEGTTRVIDLFDKTFGKGRGLAVTYPDGARDTLGLYAGLPFVTFRSSYHNPGTAPLVLNHEAALSAAVNLGLNAGDSKTLGTGGLHNGSDSSTGSYAFLAVADPKSRSGIVAGWVSEDRGSGAVFSSAQQNAITLRAQMDYGRLRLQPGASAQGEMLAVGYFDDARVGLEDYAEAIRVNYAIQLHPELTGFCTWYMEKNGGSSDEKHLAEAVNYAAQNLKAYGFNFIQVDDGWQKGLPGNGPLKDFSASRPDGPYPHGMQATAEMIKAQGLTPGIWFMPFASNFKDPLFKDHQDWFAKTAAGTPYDTSWGGTCLDMTNPDTQAFVRTMVTRIAQDWGYRLFKMDGFFTGSAVKQMYVNSDYHDDNIGESVLSNPDKTNIEAMRDGVKLVRAAAGPDVFLLGCTLAQNMRALAGSIGLVDAMRVGPDTGFGAIGAPDATRLWFLNGRVWWNDADCVNVRADMSLDQARLNASFAAISGVFFYDGDWMPDLPPERLDILRRCIPSHGLPARPVDVFESDTARIWHLPDTRAAVRRDVVALFNYDSNSTQISYPLDRIGLPPADGYAGFDYWANRFVRPFHDKLESYLPPGGSCRVLALQPLTDHPEVAGTSRHVTQGIIDLHGESWDAATATLSATSSVVGNDSYEIRVIVPVGASSWKLQTVGIAPEASAAGAKATFTQDGPKIRVTLTSPDSRDIRWGLRFAPAGITAPPPGPVTNLAATASDGRVQLKWDDAAADGFRITRGDGKPVETLDGSFVDTAVEKSTSYTYSVVPIGWTGDTGPAAQVTVTTPAPAAPPKS